MRPASPKKRCFCPYGRGADQYAGITSSRECRSHSVGDDGQEIIQGKIGIWQNSVSKPVGSDSDSHWRRCYLVSISSSEQVYISDGSVGERPVSTLGAVLHYVAVFIDGRLMAFASIERVKSGKDCSGRFGYAAVKNGIECKLGLGGSRQKVPIGVLEGVVGTIKWVGVHFILFSREPISES